MGDFLTVGAAVLTLVAGAAFALFCVAWVTILPGIGFLYLMGALR